VTQESADRSLVKMRDAKESFGCRIDGDRRESRIENHDSVTQAVDNFLPETRGQRGRLAHGDGDQIAPYHKTSDGLISNIMGDKSAVVTNAGKLML